LRPHATAQNQLATATAGLINDEARRLLSVSADAEGRSLDEVDLIPAVAALLTSARLSTETIRSIRDKQLAIRQ